MGAGGLLPGHHHHVWTNQQVCTHWPPSQAQHELRSEWRMNCVRVKKERSKKKMAEMGLCWKEGRCKSLLWREFWQQEAKFWEITLAKISLLVYLNTSQ